MQPNTPPSPLLGRMLSHQTRTHKRENSINKQVFRVYFRDGAGGWFLPILLITISVVMQFTSNVFDFWLAYWTDQYLDDGAVRAVGLFYHCL